MIKALENHQCRKCKKCPVFWYDCWDNESGCHIEEGRYGSFYRKLQERLISENYSGCFLPLWLVKIICFVENIRIYNYWKRRDSEVEK